MRSHERVRAEILARRTSLVVLLVVVVVVVVLVPRLTRRTRSSRVLVVSLATRTRGAELFLLA